MNRPNHIPEHVVETEAVRMVREAAQISIDTCLPVRIVGRPGTGKSCALWHVANIMGGSYCEITAASKKVKTMLESLLRSRGIRSGKNYATDIEEMVIDHFATASQWTDDGWKKIPRLLVVDEVQTLEITAFRELMRVQERCSLALVLAGNKERLASGKSDTETLDQVNTRIARLLYLPGPSAQDCDLLGANANVEGKEAYELLAAYGAATNFRQLSHLLEFAKRFTGGAIGIRVEHLQAALKYLNVKPDILKRLQSKF